MAFRPRPQQCIFIDAISPALSLIVHNDLMEKTSRFHRKCIHLKMLSRVKTFENGALNKKRSVWTAKTGGTLRCETH